MDELATAARTDYAQGDPWGVEGPEIFKGWRVRRSLGGEGPEIFRGWRVWRSLGGGGSGDL